MSRTYRIKESVHGSVGILDRVVDFDIEAGDHTPSADGLPVFEYLVSIGHAEVVPPASKKATSNQEAK